MIPYIFDKSELHEAAMKGEAEQVRALLEAGADVNARAFYDATPLIEACAGDKATVRKFLREHEERKAKADAEPEAAPFDMKHFPRIDAKRLMADLNRKREYDDAPVEDGTEAVRVLLHFGANVNAVDKGGHSPLMKAVMAGRVETARLLLEHGADIRATDTSHCTPLMLAAQERKLEAVQFLVEVGADADYRTPQGDTTLMAAAKGGRVEIAQLLIERGQDVNTANVNGITALQRAGAGQHDAMIAFLQAQGARVGFLEAVLLSDYERAQSLPAPEPAERGPHWGWLALHQSLRQEQASMVGLLLERWVNPNAVNDTGQAVIMQAVMRGNVECARLLLEAGADANGVQGQRTTPLAWAAQHGDKDMMDLLLAYGANANAQTWDGDSTLRGAVVYGQLETARKLLEAGADPNAKENGTPLLTFATIRDNKEMVQLLLDFGADPKQKNGVSPIFLAKDKPEVAALLRQASGTDLHELAKAGKTEELLARLDAGADINARDGSEKTLLMVALFEKRQETAKALIARGADVHAVNRHQHTALHAAVSRGDADIVRRLLAMNVNVMAGEAEGRSPLHFAASGGKTEIAALLIEAGARVGTVEAALMGDLSTLRNLLDKGADVNAPDGSGMTPLMGAVLGGHNEMITVLLTRHADINATDERGLTALAHAVSRKRLETVHLLLDSDADVNKAGIDQTMVRHMREQSLNASEETRKHFEGWDNSVGMTPLACVTMFGDTEYARLLLAYGADVNAKSGPLERPVLAWAILSGKADVIRFLLENGADPNARIRHGMSLLQMTQGLNKSEEMVALLKQYLAVKKTYPAK